jgi:hypothetical protein
MTLIDRKEIPKELDSVFLLADTLQELIPRLNRRKVSLHYLTGPVCMQGKRWAMLELRYSYTAYAIDGTPINITETLLAREVMLRPSQLERIQLEKLNKDFMHDIMQYICHDIPTNEGVYLKTTPFKNIIN